MNEQINEFSKQLQSEITRLESRLKEAQEEMEYRMKSNPYNSLDFGLARYAENITKINAQLQVLYNQQHIFKAIFVTE